MSNATDLPEKNGSPEKKGAVERYAPIIAAFASVIVAVISGIFAIIASHKSDETKEKLDRIIFIAGTIDTGSDPKFDPLPAGSERGLPPNWRVWKKSISFWSAPDGNKRDGFKGFQKPPEVFVNLKSIDASNLNGQGPRLSLSVPRDEISRDNFYVYVYTWEDSNKKIYAPAWVEISWFAYGS